MRVLVVVLLLAVAYAKHEKYQGWKSYFVGPASADQLKALAPLTEQYQVDVLSHPLVSREGVVLVPPQQQSGFLSTLESLDIKYRVHAEDVKTSLDYDDQRIAAKNAEAFLRTGKRSLPYDNYQTLDAIYAYLDDIAARFPSTVTLVTHGNSFEGRPLRYLKISTTNFEDEDKPVIFIDGGIHAREWISPPSVTWMIHKLTEDVTEPDLLNNFDWILMPVVNPDGYAYTFGPDRFWRKTRSTDSHAWSTFCPGVDGNRNYDYFWNTVGVSSNPCSDTYPGNRAFSEPETRAVRDVLDKYLHRMALYLTMHSYGSMILYPWGHDGSLSHNAFALHTVGVNMATAIDALSLPNFPNYIVGNAVLVLNYPASGASEDYAHLIGVPLSYTYELPGLAGGFQGFHLDPIYIEQVCRETWAGIVVGTRRAGELFRR
ncbi:hypothetical protein MSG28_009037 [Choristoneura fumiferana]|uniref:Uncharacterized protein n=1 Tax=Choristoneura fumiferana TaxID=7141 RepID=A0ACC0KW34_CHOFU|nr:hypothetical protein MSG28_009037 [Choristoneura fumiferana]